MNKNLCTIYLVRHGQSEGNRDFSLWLKEVRKTKLGTTLSDLGREQAGELSKKLTNVHFDAIFSSKLKRAQETAKIIAAERNLAVITKEALQERIKGNLGGKSELELKEQLGKLNIFDLPIIQNMQDLWKWKMFPDMESAEEAVSRFITALREIAVAYPGKTVLIVSHGFVMRSLLVHLGVSTFNELRSGTIINTGYIKLESDGVDFFVKEMVGVNIAKSS